MTKRRLLRGLPVILCTALIVLIPLTLHRIVQERVPVPGLRAKERTLLRIWVVNAPGGAQPWLKAQLRQFEKQHGGVSTYLRNVTAEELTAPAAILPDVLLYMPGDLTAPEAIFLPLSGETVAREGLIREELLRCGRWQGQQYGLPLCYGAWVLGIDSALEPFAAATPAPTTLLGKPAATADAGAAPEPGYPLAAASEAACAIQSPGGAALFTLGLLLAERPPLPEDFATQTAVEVYAAFRSRQTATAMLTTGQTTAFSGLVSRGSGFAFRPMTAREVITEQVWLASVTAEAPPEAALLLAHLTSATAQEALSAQGLYPVRGDLTLYASGLPAQVEQAARRGLSALNAYGDKETVRSNAWQFFSGRMTLSEALLPLL